MREDATLQTALMRRAEQDVQGKAHMQRKWTRQSSMPGGSMKMGGSLKRLQSQHSRVSQASEICLLSRASLRHCSKGSSSQSQLALWREQEPIDSSLPAVSSHSVHELRK